MSLPNIRRIAVIVRTVIMRFAYLNRVKEEIGGINIKFQSGDAIATSVRHGHGVVVDTGLM